MSEFTVETEYSREIVVKTGRGMGRMFIRVASSELAGHGIQAALTAEQATQIAHALLNVAEGKEADADRVEYSGITSELDEAYGRITLLEQRLHSLEQATTNWARSEEGAAVRLLEQRMSALEGDLQAEAAKRAASIATIAAELASKCSGVTFAVKEPEQKFYLKLTDDAYINLFTDEDVEGVIDIEDKSQTNTFQTQFTQAEIDSNPELKKFDSFKIPVPSDELAE